MRDEEEAQRRMEASRQARYVKPAEIINNSVDDGLYAATFIPV